MKGKPTIAGFLSYVHSDDEFENGRISRLRERLEQAIRFYSGIREFRIFQDWQDIGWGQQWEKMIGESIENSIVLFPTVTPSYFTSEGCRKEILAFAVRRAKLERDDLILPIYYLVCEPMVELEGDVVQSDVVAELIKRAQYEDWRALRQTEQTDPAYAQAIERLARRAIPALKRGLTASAGREHGADARSDGIDTERGESQHG